MLTAEDLVAFFVEKIRHELLSTADYRPHILSIVAALWENRLEVELPATIQSTPIPHLLLDDPRRRTFRAATASKHLTRRR